ncbi:RloB family protein [Mesonia aquimarina]|uniref:RloB family protein n=1 Tax=Mesonia aquimarina TaxID=1504967 RepID=UPI000EF5E47A|nr:RloB family protein [Mesonia aquimarina]
MPKKTKAIKKTDRKKAWLKKVKPSIYEIETKDVNKTILIVAEGQTETLYFESFPVLSLTVKTVNVGGQSKLKLIEATENIVNNATVKFDSIWCVFDMDVRQEEKEFADFDNAIESGNSKSYKLAYSNDCFELWFYLHYNFTDQKNHRIFYYRQLGNMWDCNYEKEGKKYDFCLKSYSRLESDENASQEKAIERAKKLYENQKGLSFHEQNPITLVYELVEFLNKNCRP